MVKRSNLDGTSPETVASGLNYAYGITVDSTNGHIYFSDLDGKGIYRSETEITRLHSFPILVGPRFRYSESTHLLVG